MMKSLGIQRHPGTKGRNVSAQRNLGIKTRAHPGREMAEVTLGKAGHRKDC